MIATRVPLPPLLPLLPLLRQGKLARHCTSGPIFGFSGTIRGGMPNAWSASEHVGPIEQTSVWVDSAETSSFRRCTRSATATRWRAWIWLVKSTAPDPSLDDLVHEAYERDQILRQLPFVEGELLHLGARARERSDDDRVPLSVMKDERLASGELDFTEGVEDVARRVRLPGAHRRREPAPS